MSAFYIQNFTGGSGDMEGNSPVGCKSLCSVVMQCWPLFHAVSFFPDRMMLFWLTERPPLLTEGTQEGSKPSLQVRRPGWNSLFGPLAAYCVALSREPYHSMPQFPQLSKEENSAYLIGWQGGLRPFEYTKYLTGDLADSTCTGNDVSLYHHHLHLH